jgi:hypothetical protein
MVSSITLYDIPHPNWFLLGGEVAMNIAGVSPQVSQLM